MTSSFLIILALTLSTVSAFTGTKISIVQSKTKIEFCKAVGKTPIWTLQGYMKQKEIKGSW